ncbi:esterase/lipase family protein [Thioflexithrix psekupsensis]|uniref:GPI inositol-deacylase PGAP1-like alpha/beta domain-containing protein n=1 Tax=Thioflexithrix psekupsensis TaxID=1570016 RepID=A0A251X8J9_9GAMM|nr:alpha/beta fold hydrolase [Thioflexithrix psekupsensis]OUD14326.1 hypothetical protein TPSD3_08370 [Thioflexithrix psekupsensis]
MRRYSLLLSLLPLLFFFNLLTSATVMAGQTVVLIHGYLGGGYSWYINGISATLHHAGWPMGGEMSPFPALAPVIPQAAGDYHYTIVLPSEAPIMIQAQHVQAYLQLIQQRHPENELILIGHSAGGVVARFVLVSQPQWPVKALITIASPHLGTAWADTGLSIVHSPFGWITPFLGLGTLNRSVGLYADLLPEMPGSFLFWLNRQPHPQDVEYIAILRGSDPGLHGDGVVPALSQDLNRVFALQGRARLIPTWGQHDLHPGDGLLLVQVLKELRGD